MKKVVVLFTSIFVGLMANVGFAQIKILEVIEVDSVTSDFPVNFSFVSQGEWQFIGYFNKDRSLTVASKKTSDKRWAYKILPTKVGWDSHNAITMTIDRENCIHISGNMHNDTLTYFKTEKPFQISTFQRVFPQVSSQDELRCTYPNFMKDANNRLVFTYRKGGSGNGISISNVYDEATKSFKRLSDKPLFDGLGEMSAYQSGPKLESDGYFHLTWVWRDTPDSETNHDLSYAKSKDLIHWETLKGEKIDLPITPRKSQFTVDAIPAKGGILNGSPILIFDNEKRPLIAYYKYNSAGSSEVFIANTEGKEWKTKQISNWNYRWAFSGPGSIDGEIKLISAEFPIEGNIVINYWHIKRGYGKLIVDKTNIALIEDKQTDIIESEIYPAELLKPNSGLEGMSVKWLKGAESKQNTNEYYAFRWETMGKRRFYEKREKAIAPTSMKLYRFLKVK